MLLFQASAATSTHKKKDFVPPLPAYVAVREVANMQKRGEEEFANGFRKETREVSIFGYSESSKPELRGSLYFWMPNSEGKMKDPRYSLAYESLVDLNGSLRERIYLDFKGMELTYTNSKGEEVTIEEGDIIKGQLLSINKKAKDGEGYELTLKHGTRKPEVYNVKFSEGTVEWKSGIIENGSEVTTFSIKEVSSDESRKSVSLYLLDEKGEKITDLTENHWKHIFAIAKRRNELADLLEDNNRQIVIGGEGFKTDQTALDADYIRKGATIERDGNGYVLKLKNGIEMDWSDLQSIIDSIKKTNVDFDSNLTEGSVGGNQGTVNGYAYFVGKDEQGIKYEIKGAAYRLKINDLDGWYSEDAVTFTK